jgi:hypothetical protein
MNASTKLVEQNFRSWESNLAHADVTAAPADAAQRVLPVAGALDAELTLILADLDRCAKTISEMRWQPFEYWAESSKAKHSEDLKGVLATVGEQFDMVLAAMFELDKKI